MSDASFEFDIRDRRNEAREYKTAISPYLNKDNVFAEIGAYYLFGYTNMFLVDTIDSISEKDDKIEIRTKDGQLLINTRASFEILRRAIQNEYKPKHQKSIEFLSKITNELDKILNDKVASI